MDILIQYLQKKTLAVVVVLYIGLTYLNLKYAFCFFIVVFSYTAACGIYLKQLDKKYLPRETVTIPTGAGGTFPLYKELYDLVEEFEHKHKRPPYHSEIGDHYCPHIYAPWKLLRERSLFFCIEQIRRIWLS